MKNKILAFVMAAVMAFTVVPVSPFVNLFSIEAAAVDTSELQKVYDSIPPKDEWGKYIDTKVLEAYYDVAKAILSGSVTSADQSYIDSQTENLRNAFNNLKLHTQGIVLDKTEAAVEIGETLQLAATLSPFDAADPIEWRSGDSEIASVSSTGLVTVKKYSETGVTILASSNNITASCKIITLNPVAGVKLSDTNKEIFQNRSFNLTAQVFGKDDTVNPTEEFNYTWKSSNPSVATVSADGQVTGVGQGTCQITVTATSDNGKTHTATCEVKVSKFVYITALNPITSIPATGLSATEGETRTISIKVVPSTASMKDLKWTSSNEAIAKVSESKVTGDTVSVEITCLRQGMAKITYEAQDSSGKTGEFNITVKPKITSLKLTETIKVLTLDSKGEKIGTEITPSDAGNQILEWSSSNTGVCAVDYDGVLYPGGVGTCVITAKTTDGSDITVTCKIRVTSLATKVTLDKNTLTLTNGKSQTLQAVVTTESGDTHSDVIWTSSNEDVATVSQSGVVKTLYPGKTVITATAADGSGKKATCQVTVTQPVTGVTLPANVTVSVGGHTTLTPTVIPEYASDVEVTWQTSDPEIVTVDSTGKITGVKVGTAMVSCKTVNGGYSASCTVNVIIGVNGVKLSQNIMGLKSGETGELRATVTPEGATNKAVTWVSSNPEVASVDSAGIVTAKNGGTCVITVTTADGGYTDKCTVSVDQDVSGIEIQSPPANLYVGQDYDMVAKIYPETATNQKITWFTSDASVVLVASTTGKLKALKAGSAVITAQTENGLHDTCVITVGNKVSVTGVSLDTGTISLEKNDEYLLLAEISPSNASDKALRWNSSNLTVATVDKDGVVKAVGAGSALITVTTNDGNYRAQCRVTVVQPVNGVKFSETDVRVPRDKTKSLTATVLPTNATNKDLMWFSSDSSVASIDQNGLVTALKSGITDITVTSVDGGYSAHCKITVYVAVTGVTINATNVNVPRGDKRTVTATVKPKDAENSDLIWTSANDSVATVNASGVITGKTKGTTTITVKTEDGGFSDTITVEVVQLVNKMTLDYTSTSLDSGKTKTLTATISPSTASDTGIKWSSSNTKVAKVSSKGVVTAVSAGTAIITASSRDGNASVTCKITVTQPATGISLSSKSMYVDLGSKVTIKANVKPSNVTSKYVTWTSSNRSVATVSSSGVVKGLKTGKTVITAATANGTFKASCTVTVIVPVTGVSIDKTSLRINVGKASTLSAVVKPSNASIKTIKWTSSDNDVATVDSNGKVTAKAPGYVTITAKSKDNGKTATCRVLVVQPVSGVTLNKTSIKLEQGADTTLKTTVKPSNASDKKVTWSSSNKKVATVDSNGKITATGKGTATITVKTVDGAKKATCKVTVIKSVTGVKLNAAKASLYIGKTLTLKATVIPSSASDKKVKWYTSNSDIAAVSQEGVVTPKAPGVVTISVKTYDGQFVAKCSVTVKRPVTSVKLNKTDVTLNSGKTYTLKASVVPSNATEKDITWTTSNKKVATVSSNGKITAVAKGTATITAKSVNGIKTTCKVTVVQQVTSIKLSDTTITVYIGETAKLTASALPSNANDKKLSYTVSNDDIITFASGKITPKNTGTATITVKASNGIKATCKVIVKRHVSSVKLNETKLTLVRGENFTLKATVYPLNATEKGVTFKSSNTSVVTVTSKGILEAVKGGTAKITVTSKENNKTSVCTVTVNEPVTGVSLNKSKETIFVGEKLSLKATVTPADAYNKNIKWYTSDKAVAAVDQNGNVTAISSGTATISVKTYDGKFTDKCVVTVNRKATGIELNANSVIIDRGAVYELVATVLPYDCYNKNITWISSDETVAVVNGGAVTALKVGEAVITVKAEDGGFEAQCNIVVKEPVTSLTIDKTEMTLHNGESGLITATVLPENAANRNVIWTSSDETVATVENGKVLALKKGTVTITAKAEDGDFSASCEVTVLQNVTQIKTEKDIYYVHEGEKIRIGASAVPENAENKQLTWESSDKNIATAENGEITALKLGKVEIKISSVYTHGVSKTVTVIVTRPVSDVTLNKAAADILVGGTVTLISTVLPEDAANKEVLWSSSDENVAVVKNGTVSGISRGQATITVTTVDGNKTAVCVINVIQPVTRITFEKDSYTFIKGENSEIKYTVYPENANDKTLTWTSSDEKVIAVLNGEVAPVSPGAATITATDSSGIIKTSVNVTVISKVGGVKLDRSEGTLDVGGKLTLTATVTPDDATDKTVTWSSSNQKVASVSNIGVVTAIARGEAIITATTKDGEKTAQCKIMVSQPVTEIVPQKDSYTVEAGDKKTISVTVLPENANNQTVLWHSSDESIVTVDKGEITALKKGKAVITVTDETGLIKAEINVEVIVKATGVELDKSEITVKVGESAKLVAKVLPEDASNINIQWLSSDVKIATVKNGEITAVAKGQATITVRTVDGGYMATCLVTVE